MEPERTTDAADHETPPSQLWVRLGRYLVGDLTVREQADVERWLTADPRRAAAVTELRAAWEQRAEPYTAVDVERALLTVANHIGLSDQHRSGIAKPRKHMFRRLEAWTVQGAMFKAQPLRRWGWSAATALILGIVVLLSHRTRYPNQGTAQSALLYTTYTTGNGERSTITFPNGGTVTLNVASRLEIPVDYMAGNHTVRLVGEGLFTVPHRDAAPLTILAGATTAKVLGTSFVVRHYATDTTTLVAVREGKVAVGPTVVTAAQLVEVGRAGVPRIRSSDASPFTFATGVLTLDGIPLADAIAELDRWYDVDIRLGSPSLATHKLRGECTAGSVEDLPENLELALDVRVVRNGRTLTLYPKS